MTWPPLEGAVLAAQNQVVCCNGLRKFNSGAKEAFVVLEGPHDNAVLRQIPFQLFVVEKYILAYVKRHRAGDAHACHIDIMNRDFIKELIPRQIKTGVRRGLFFECHHERWVGIFLSVLLAKGLSVFSWLQHGVHTSGCLRGKRAITASYSGKESVIVFVVFYVLTPA